MNPYQTLGLKEGASMEDVKKAYRLYAMHFHPDKHGNLAFFNDRFREIQEAYDLIQSGYVVDKNNVYAKSEADYRNEIRKLKQTIKLLESAIDLCNTCNNGIMDLAKTVKDTLKGIKY